MIRGRRVIIPAKNSLERIIQGEIQKNDRILLDNGVLLGRVTSTSDNEVTIEGGDFNAVQIFRICKK